MARSSYQKLKLFYLLRMLREKTDSEHMLKMNEIIKGLECYGIQAERKSIYDDINTLRQLGFDIRNKKGREYGYYLNSREFNYDELSFIATALETSPHVPKNRVDTIIDKLRTLTSAYRGRQLKRNIYLTRREEAEGEMVYRTIDTIHQAIQTGRKISFRYVNIGVDKRKYFEKGERERVISPYGITVTNGQFYAVGYYDAFGSIAHFRIDRMEMVTVLKEKAREQGQYFQMEQHLKRVFQLQGGMQPDLVKLKFHNSLIEPVLDRFGHESDITPLQKEYFMLKTNLVIDPDFLGWLFQFGNMVEILAPQSLITQLKSRAKLLLEQYEAHR